MTAKKALLAAIAILFGALFLITSSSEVYARVQNLGRVRVVVN